jgi:hypothetical protein
MSTKKFIIKTVVKIIAFAIVSTVAITLLQSPIISNEIALGQMENSDGLFILMELYNKLRPLIVVIYSCIVLLFISAVGYDTYNFIKTKLKEKTQDEKH